LLAGDGGARCSSQGHFGRRMIPASRSDRTSSGHTGARGPRVACVQGDMEMWMALEWSTVVGCLGRAPVFQEAGNTIRAGGVRIGRPLQEWEGISVEQLDRTGTSEA